jgi:hypothetical protein
VSEEGAGPPDTGPLPFTRVLVLAFGAEEEDGGGGYCAVGGGTCEDGIKKASG